MNKRRGIAIILTLAAVTLFFFWLLTYTSDGAPRIKVSSGTEHMVVTVVTWNGSEPKEKHLSLSLKTTTATEGVREGGRDGAINEETGLGNLVLFFDDALDERGGGSGTQFPLTAKQHAQLQEAEEGTIVIFEYKKVPLSILRNNQYWRAENSRVEKAVTIISAPYAWQPPSR